MAGGRGVVSACVRETLEQVMQMTGTDSADVLYGSINGSNTPDYIEGLLGSDTHWGSAIPSFFVKQFQCVEVLPEG